MRECVRVCAWESVHVCVWARKRASALSVCVCEREREREKVRAVSKWCHSESFSAHHESRPLSAATLEQKSEWVNALKLRGKRWMQDWCDFSPPLPSFAAGSLSLSLSLSLIYLPLSPSLPPLPRFHHNPCYPYYYAHSAEIGYRRRFLQRDRFNSETNPWWVWTQITNSVTAS